MRLILTPANREWHMASTVSRTHEQIIARLSQEFLTDAGDRIGVIEKALGNGSSPDPEAVMTIRREVHNIKGTGGSFGFPVISLIAHRLEDYMSGLDVLDERHVSDMAVFVDRLADIIEVGRDPDDSAAEALVRSLPAHRRPISSCRTRSTSKSYWSRLQGLFPWSRCRHSGPAVTA